MVRVSLSIAIRFKNIFRLANFLLVIGNYISVLHINQEKKMRITV